MHAVHAARSSDADLQRSIGSCRIVLKGLEQKNQIVDVFQRAPVRGMFRRWGAGGFEGPGLINRAGGVAGGDRLDTDVTALAGATITLTSQTAERIYCALDQPARISTTLTAHAAAKLAWCPQETIVFNGARVRRETRLALDAGAELL